MFQNFSTKIDDIASQEVAKATPLASNPCLELSLYCGACGRAHGVAEFPLTNDHSFRYVGTRLEQVDAM